MLTHEEAIKKAYDYFNTYFAMANPGLPIVEKPIFSFALEEVSYIKDQNTYQVGFHYHTSDHEEYNECDLCESFKECCRGQGKKIVIDAETGDFIAAWKMW